MLEPTSGTTSGEKLIPYTDGLRHEFQRAIATWIGDLFLHCPNVRHGRAFWSISPVFATARHSAGGIRIGFDDDTAYLSSWERPFVGKLLAVSAVYRQVGHRGNLSLSNASAFARRKRPGIDLDLESNILERSLVTLGYVCGSTSGR